jgi:ABC-2 type transport system permease protein
MIGRMASGWRGALALAVREWIRFFRQPSRVIGALGQPVLLWLLLGIGLGRSFQGAGGIGFSEY